ncbi:MAG: hypothetical protein II040_05360 [Muribaculaceae bacterium]|nr:hypothetical protein [Muribaculaceae bacterium]
MRRPMIHNATELMDYIQQVGFLPLLDSGIAGYSADEAVDPDCRYVLLDDGGWDWPLWDWKGPIVTESDCVYGKFFNKKAGFVSRSWWPDLYNWRRHSHPAPSPGSIEETILMTLREHGSMITRDLRRACGFTEPKMRSRFDGYVTRLQMACRIVTEDFVYPQDKHGKRYGWGWALLSTPEQLLGKEACHCDRTPEESLARMLDHLRRLLPRASEQQITKLIK